MAIGSYIRGGAKAVKKGLSTVGTYLLKPIDAVIAKEKEVERQRVERSRKMIDENFGNIEVYNKLQEEERLRMKKNLEAKEKGMKKASYVKTK